ncbi:MAG: hypothetical protein CVU65_12315 [Deltaproteobacteria bacterium HGW-Deltaproteobacteria-22]|jgi:hypothetical protein|nr:MAG: hypothetical protein CVU65_12315 [Deltaproteobacteria bacterium HGW-Deltaproteobacteria-22]
MRERIIAICLEDCYPVHESLRFLQCTALKGEGLFVGEDGVVGNDGSAPAYCQLRVTGDDRLAALATGGMLAGARVHRGGRFVDLSTGKPVILCDGDFLAVPGRCYQIHVHGEAARASEPSYLHAKEPASSTLARLAAAGLVAVTSMAGSLGCTPRESNVNEKPEVTPDRPQPPRPEPPAGKEPQQKVDPIDVRDEPPVIAPDPNYP